MPRRQHAICQRNQPNRAMLMLRRSLDVARLYNLFRSQQCINLHQLTALMDCCSQDDCQRALTHESITRTLIEDADSFGRLGFSGAVPTLGSSNLELPGEPTESKIQMPGDNNFFFWRTSLKRNEIILASELIAPVNGGGEGQKISKPNLPTEHDRNCFSRAK